MQTRGSSVNKANNPRIFYGYVIVVVSFFILAIIWGTSLSYGVYFEPLLAQFGWTRATTSGASSVNNLAFGIFCIVVARLSDKFNPRIIISICGIVLGIGYLLMSQTQALWQLYVYYGILVAFGMSAYIATLSIVARWFHKRRGLATGIVFTGMGLGVTITPPIVNWLIATYDWQRSLIVLGVISLLIMVPGAQFLKRDPREIGQLPYGMNYESNERSTTAIKGFSLREAIHTRQFWLICGMYFIFLFCQLVVTIHIVIHAIGLGISPGSSAGILAIIGGVCIIGLNAVGLAGDRFGNRLAFAGSFILTALTFLWLLIAKDTIMLYLFAVFFGLAYGGIQVLFSPMVAELFGLKAHSVILGSCALFGTIGAALGPFLAGYVFDTTGSYNPIFITCAILAAVAVIMIILIKTVKTMNLD